MARNLAYSASPEWSPSFPGPKGGKMGREVGKAEPQTSVTAPGAWVGGIRSGVPTPCRSHSSSDRAPECENRRSSFPAFPSDFQSAAS